MSEALGGERFYITENGYGRTAAGVAVPSGATDVTDEVMRWYDETGWALTGRGAEVRMARLWARNYATARVRGKRMSMLMDGEDDE